MDIYCQQCGEPWDLHEINDWDRTERMMFRKGECCPACYSYSKGKAVCTMCKGEGILSLNMEKAFDHFTFCMMTDNFADIMQKLTGDANIMPPIWYERNYIFMTCSRCMGHGQATPYSDLISDKLTPAEATKILTDLIGDDYDGIVSELDDLFGN